MTDGCLQTHGPPYQGPGFDASVPAEKLSMDYQQGASDGGGSVGSVVGGLGGGLPGARGTDIAAVSGLQRTGRVAYLVSMSRFPVTPVGFTKLKEELHRLKSVERPKISKEIGAARELGDLSENFEYHAAKDRQGMVEARIRDLEDKLSRVDVIDPSKLSGDRVVFGATVVLTDVDTGSEQRFQIVGEVEANVESGRISVTSPMARALIGKEVGDEVRVPGKGGPRTVEIADVSFAGVAG
jgi:transcription elongation factor GreA